MIGLYVLSRRRCNWGIILRENAALTILLIYMLLSIAWSDYPFVSFKRFVKLFASVSMALVVLSEPNRVEAITTVIRRSAYICIPMSIVLIRYFRNLGVAFDYMGTSSSWQGVATSKNTLGQVAMTSALCFIWERVRRGNPKEGRWIDFLYIAMSMYLLKGQEGHISMTSLSVFAVGLSVFLMLQRFKHRPAAAGLFFKVATGGIFALLTLVIVHSVVGFSEDSMFGEMITTFGRDLTLTGRTEIWDDVYQIAARNPIFGVGFGGFWIGREANIPWNANMSWVLGQSHDGYVDAYLQLGWMGFFLLAAVFLSSIKRICQLFESDFEYARFCMVFFCVIIFVNITETTLLRGDHNMWFLFLVVILAAPRYAFAGGAEEEPAVTPEIEAQSETGWEPAAHS
jgi:O-antigen ligase